MAGARRSGLGVVSGIRTEVAEIGLEVGAADARASTEVAAVEVVSVFFKHVEAKLRQGRELMTFSTGIGRCTEAASL
jgi:hypothetical protein